jgi:hypothetical protein
MYENSREQVSKAVSIRSPRRAKKSAKRVVKPAKAKQVSEKHKIEALEQEVHEYVSEAPIVRWMYRP